MDVREGGPKLYGEGLDKRGIDGDSTRAADIVRNCRALVMATGSTTWTIRVSSVTTSIIGGTQISQASSDIDGLPENKRPSMVAVAAIAVSLVSSCGLNTAESPVMTESSHTRREQCDRTLTFFARDLGISSAGIEYGSGAPGEKIGLGALCTITQDQLAVGQTRLRAMLPDESKPALLEDDLSYIPLSGTDEKVWIKKAASAVYIVTQVDGWQGTLDIQTAQINLQESRISAGRTKFEVSDLQIRTASQFLLTLTEELGAQG